MKHLLFASCLTLAVLPMCKPDSATTKTTAVDPAAPTEARAQFDILRDSADASWTRMVRSDDQKLADMSGLVQDLKKQSTLDKATLADFSQHIKDLKDQRYDRQTMAESARIDQYDAQQDAVLKKLVPLAAPDGNAPTEAVRDYVEHIQQADDNVIAYRVQYDRAAKAYNAYLQTHREALAKAGGKYARLQPLPLFTLVE